MNSLIILKQGTDSKHFQNIGYEEGRIPNPVDMSKSEFQGIHGYDEHISIGS